MEKFNGVEVCPYCGYENEFSVYENEWIIQCECCGLPIVTCDRCIPDEADCANCKRDKKIRELENHIRKIIKIEIEKENK